MALPATDGFSQTSGSTQALTTYSANWAIVEGGFNVPSGANAAAASALNYNTARWTADTFNADQYSQSVITSTLLADGTFGGAAVRCQSGAVTLYHAHTDGSNVYVDKSVAGTKSGLAGPLSQSFAAGDVIRLEVTGTGATVTLKVFRAAAASPTVFTQIGSDITDTAGDRITAAGSAGIFCYDFNNAGNCRITNWEGGNLSSGDATVTGQTITVTGSVIAGSASGPLSATVNGQTLTANVSLIRRAVEQYVPEDLFIFGDTESNESSAGGQKLFGGYAASGTDATVTGQTITVTGSVIPGTATGVQNATVTGQTLTVTGSVIAGTASASSNATVNGQTITVNGSVIAGSVSADSSVAGLTITVNASVIPGSATGTGDASVAGQTITVDGSVIAGSASGSSNATVNGQTLAVTASLIAGAVTADSSVAGQTLTVAASLIAGGVAVDSVAAGTVINIAASIIAGSASAPANATVNGQTIVINGSTIPGAAFGPSAGGQRWRSIGMHLGLRL